MMWTFIPSFERRSRQRTKTANSSISVWRGVALLSIAAVGGFVLTALNGSSRNDALQGSGQATLLVDEKDLDFGVVYAQRNLEWRMPITNASNHEVAVKTIRTSCGCTSVAPKSFVLNPGQTLTTTLSLNLLPKNRRDAATATRDFVVALEPVTQPPQPSGIKWRLTGQVRAPLVLSPSEANFHDSIVRDGPQPVRTISISCEHSIDSLRVNCDNPNFPVEARRDTETPDHRFLLQIAPRDGIPLGAFGFTVEIQASTRAGEDLPAVSLPVLGRVLDDIRLVPEVLVLRRSDAQDCVIVSSRSGTPISDADADVDPASGLQVERTAQSNEKAEFRISSKASTGTQSARVRFRLQLRGRPTPVESSVLVVY